MITYQDLETARDKARNDQEPHHTVLCIGGKFGYFVDYDYDNELYIVLESSDIFSEILRTSDPHLACHAFNNLGIEP